MRQALRNGVDWIAAPEVVIGMEGAPGHQAAGLPTPHSTADGGVRGPYGSSAGTYSFGATLSRPTGPGAASTG